MIGCEDNPMSSYPVYDFDVTIENYETDVNGYYH